MPMTRSEAMFFTAGLVIGAAAGAELSRPERKVRTAALGCIGRRGGGLRRIVFRDGQEGRRKGRGRARRDGRDEAVRRDRGFAQWRGRSHRHVRVDATSLPATPPWQPQIR